MVRVAGYEFDAVMRGRHVRPMDFTGRPLKGFVYVSPSGFRTVATLREWLARGERVAVQKATRPAMASARRKSLHVVGRRPCHWGAVHSFWSRRQRLPA